MKIAVVTDSGSGFTKESAKEQGIYFLPLQVINGNTTYLDGYDTSVEEVYEVLRGGALLKTSMPPAGIVEETFTKIKEEGYDHILAVPLTTGISSTTQTLQSVASMVDIDITCVEIYSTCIVQYAMTQAVKRMVDEGKTLEEILPCIEASVKESKTFVIPDDLDTLKRGGRLTPLAATLAGMLKIKPILEIDIHTNGKIEAFNKVRTMSKAVNTAVDAFAPTGENEGYEFVILHAAAESLAKEIEQTILAKYPGCSTSIHLIGPVIAAHTGLGCIALQMIKKV